MGLGLGPKDTPGHSCHGESALDGMFSTGGRAGKKLEY